MDQKPHWMEDHEAEDRRRFDEITSLIREQNEILRPIAAMYQAAGLLGKWAMAALVFLSVLFGVIASVKGLIHK